MKFCSKKSHLLTCEILELLVNTLATDEKYPILNRENLKIQNSDAITSDRKTFSKFFPTFLKSRLNFKYFEKKDDPHSFCIAEITNSQNVVTSMSKKSRFRGAFDIQHGKRAQELLKFTSDTLYNIQRSAPRKLSRKKSVLLTCKILGLLLNTLATDEKYPVLNRDNLTIPIQMQLSQKQKSFSQVFATFSKNRLNFEHFFKKRRP